MPVTLYAHLTWTTFQRGTSIDAPVARFLDEFLPKAARRYGVDVVAKGIVTDHVHLLLMLPPVIDLPRLVQGLKGASARIANRDRIGREHLRWASGYDLRSVSPRALPAAMRYVERHDIGRGRDSRGTGSRPG